MIEETGIETIIKEQEKVNLDEIALDKYTDPID